MRREERPSGAFFQARVNLVIQMPKSLGSRAVDETALFSQSHGP